MPYDESWKPKHNPWAIALTVTLATFMEVLDTSIANVALPHIAGSLGASQDEATWVLTSYLVSSAVVLPISGWLSNRFGRKRFYMTCVALFTICSLFCGLAPSLPILIVARILQGAGGGGLAPSEQAILADTFPVEKRGQAFAVYGMAVVVAPAIGPTLGGWITDNFNWHWIFFINLPIGLISLWLSHRMVEDPPIQQQRRIQARNTRVDFTGLALVASGVGCLEFFLDKGQEKDWFGSSLIVTFATLAVTLLVVFVFWEWNHKDPIVDLKLLKNRNFGTAVFLQLILGMVLFGSTVLIPQYLQTLLGYTAERAGMVLSPGGFVLMFMMIVAGPSPSSPSPSSTRASSSPSATPSPPQVSSTSPASHSIPASAPSPCSATKTPSPSSPGPSSSLYPCPSSCVSPPPAPNPTPKPPPTSLQLTVAYFAAL